MDLEVSSREELIQKIKEVTRAYKLGVLLGWTGVEFVDEDVVDVAISRIGEFKGNDLVKWIVYIVCNKHTNVDKVKDIIRQTDFVDVLGGALDNPNKHEEIYEIVWNRRTEFEGKKLEKFLEYIAKGKYTSTNMLKDVVKETKSFNIISSVLFNSNVNEDIVKDVWDRRTEFNEKELARLFGIIRKHECATGDMLKTVFQQLLSSSISDHRNFPLYVHLLEEVLANKNTTDDVVKDFLDSKDKYWNCVDSVHEKAYQKATLLSIIFCSANVSSEIKKVVVKELLPDLDSRELYACEGDGLTIYSEHSFAIVRCFEKKPMEFFKTMWELRDELGLHFLSNILKDLKYKKEGLISMEILRGAMVDEKLLDDTILDNFIEDINKKWCLKIKTTNNIYDIIYAFNFGYFDNKVVMETFNRLDDFDENELKRLYYKLQSILINIDKTQGFVHTPGSDVLYKDIECTPVPDISFLYYYLCEKLNIEPYSYLKYLPIRSNYVRK